MKEAAGGSPRTEADKPGFSVVDAGGWGDSAATWTWESPAGDAATTAEEEKQKWKDEQWRQKWDSHNAGYEGKWPQGPYPKQPPKVPPKNVEVHEWKQLGGS